MKSQELPKKTSNIPKVRKKSNSTLASLMIGRERTYLFDDLSLMMKSGISVQSSLSLIRRNARQKYFKKTLSKILDSVDEGRPLWQSLDEAGIFSSYSISLVRVGEETGKLAENLELIAKHEEKQRTLNSKIITAVSYPLFVLSLTVLIAIGAVWFIFPKLSTVFHSLNVPLPRITKILISLGDVMRTHGLIIVVTFAGVSLLAICILFIIKPTQKYGDMLLLHIPGIRTLIKQVEIERFGFLLGTLLDAGLPINASLESLHRATRIHAYRKMYKSIATDVENGISLENSFKNIRGIDKLIPLPVLEMISTGERSGRLPIVLQEIGNRYTKKTELSTNNLTQMLEPFLLVFVWLGVLCIALAVIVPIYGLVGNLNSPNQRKSTTTTVTKPLDSQQIEIYSTQPGDVKIFALPDLTSDVIGKAKNGELYKYTEIRPDWYKIELADKPQGWIPIANTKLKN